MDSQIQARINQRLLGELPRFFRGYTAMLRELYQNAHRAGTTELSITLDDTLTLLTFTDNGAGCFDPQQLLSAGLTGWDEDAIVEPAGMGFFSLLNPNLVAAVNVESVQWAITLRPEHVLAGKPVVVRNSGVTRKGMRVEVRFKLPVYERGQYEKPEDTHELDNIVDARGIYPMRVFINGKECPNKDWDAEYEIPTSVGLIGARGLTSQRQAYWEYRPINGHAFREALDTAAENSNDPLAKLVLDHYTIDWIVNPDCGVRPQLPGRDELIAGHELNKACEIILAELLKVLRVDYAKAVKKVPDFGISEHYYSSEIKNLQAEPGAPVIPNPMALDILRAFGWRTHRFEDPSTYNYTSNEYDANSDIAVYSLYDKHALPVACHAIANTVNLLRWRESIKVSAYVSDASDTPVVIKGLKCKDNALVAIAKSITFNGENLPFLLLDQDSQEKILGPDANAYVIIAGDYLQAVHIIKEYDDLRGWVAMQVNDNGSLYDYDDWMVKAEDNDGDEIDLGEVETEMITDVMDNYGDKRVSVAASRYYAMQAAGDRLGDARRAVNHFVQYEKTGDKAVDAALAKLLAAIKRVEKQVDAAELANGIKAKLVEKPKPVKKAKPRSKK